MPLAVEWIEDSAGFAALADEWDALLPQESSPFDLHDWYLAWWDAFAGGSELAVCTVRRDGELAGAFPLARKGRALSGLANGHSGIFRPLARDREAMAALAAAALAAPASTLELRLLPAADPSLPVIEASARDAGMLPVAEAGTVSPIVDTRGDFEAWRRGQKASWKSRIARYGRKMQRDHDARLDIVVQPDDLEAWLDDGFRVEASGWKGKEGTAILSAPETASFYRDMARRFHQRGELRLNRISLDGEVVAFSLCILSGSRLYSLKAGFDERWKKLVPGLVLQLSIVERCFEMRLDAYELLGDTSEWKEKLSTGARPYTTLWAYPRGPVGALRYAYRASLRPTLKRAYRRIRPGRR